MKHRVPLIAAALVAGCAVQPRVEIASPAMTGPVAPLKAMHTRETTLANRFRLCDEGCPQRTPKHVATTPFADAATSEAVIAHALPVVESAALPPLPQIVPVVLPATPPKPLRIVSVRFALASTAIDPTARRLLAATVIELNSDHATRSLEIHRRTDDLGSQSANDALATARGLAVRNALRELGLRSDLDVTVRSQGKCCYLADNTTEAGRQQNRRAELVFLGGNAT